MKFKVNPKDIINTSIHFSSEQDTLESIIKDMIKLDISSVLVTNAKGLVTGIITERDIVRKFTLLDYRNKLTSKANTVMTRPVKFIRIDQMYKDAEELHVNHKVRHFPVLMGEEPLRKNVVGMLTITDFFRHHLHNYNEEVRKQQTSKVLVLASDTNVRKYYGKLLHGIGFEAILDTLTEESLRRREQVGIPALIDLDSEDNFSSSKVLQKAKKYPGEVLLLTSNSKTYPIIASHLDEVRHHIVMKPVDLSYLIWIFSRATLSRES